MARSPSLLPSAPEQHHLTLNTDGRRHPRENLLTIVAAGAAAISIVCAFVPALHILGGWTGIVGLLLGGVAQYLSATTAERWIIVPAIVASGVGLAFALDYGGLW